MRCEAENRYVDCHIIKPQTFYGLVEIERKLHISDKN